MHHRLRTLLCTLALLLACASSFGLEIASLTRQDGHAVPVAVHAPARDACDGIAVISPGAGGSEAGYRYLGEAMSSFGYLALVVGHRESGREALRRFVAGANLREGLARLLTDPDAHRGRALDIAAARAWALSRCPAARATVLIGHSMGAASVLIEAGAQNRVGAHGSDSFDAYVALSPQGVGTIFPQHAWSSIARPVLSITGTRDDELGRLSWETRTEPFADMRAGCKWLLVVEGATHMDLGGRGGSQPVETQVVRVIGAFLDGVRRGDCRAPAELQGLDLRAK